MVDHREGEGVFEDVVGLGKSALDVAPLIAVLMAQVGAVDEGAVRGEGAEHVVDDRQLFILHVDEGDRLLSRGLVHGGHGGDGLPLKADLLHGKDGPVLEVRTVVGVDVVKLVARQDSDHAPELPRSGGVEPGDSRVRQWAGEELAEGHPRDLQVANVGGLALHLLHSIRPNDGSAY